MGCSALINANHKRLGLPETPNAKQGEAVVDASHKQIKHPGLVGVSSPSENPSGCSADAH